MKTANKIIYGRGYKYQLRRDWCIQTPIVGKSTDHAGIIYLSDDGLLTIRALYAWDGASGLTIDTPDFMRGSLAHDALYQLMREGKLSQDCRSLADKLLHDLCREDGMSRFRAWYVYRAVRMFGDSAAKPKPPRDIEAP